MRSLDKSGTSPRRLLTGSIARRISRSLRFPTLPSPTRARSERDPTRRLTTRRRFACRPIIRTPRRHGRTGALLRQDHRDGRLRRRRPTELGEAGLAEDTIVFYYADHGSGMPRSKRWPYNSGLHVPLIVCIPEKFAYLRPADCAAGGTSGRLVSFVDLAPTVLSLAGINPPAHMQGAAFAGEFGAEPRENLHGFRERTDERYEMVRGVRDERHLYVRNYMPHEIYGQLVAYVFQTPTTRVWKQLFDKGKLYAEQARFWQAKPPEELYDLEVDPDEVRNVAMSPEHRWIVECFQAPH